MGLSINGFTSKNFSETDLMKLHDKFFSPYLKNTDEKIFWKSLLLSLSY
jgi:hypothetical protein